MKRLRYLCILFVSAAVPPLSAERPTSLAVGESKVFSVQSADQVAIGNPEVARVKVVSAREILITGLTPGQTNLVFISPGGRRQTRTIIVHAQSWKRAMVEVGVEMLEIESRKDLEGGLRYGSIFEETGLQPVWTLNEQDPPPLLKIGTLERSAVAGAVKLLLERGKARLLAKPRLLTLSGEPAEFLSGGEIPYVVENKVGSSSVEFKPYGVKLAVTPKVEPGGQIHAKLRAEVSGLDLQNAVSPAGTGFVPALKTRWAQTQVYVDSGSTLVIAGLLQEDQQKVSSGLPLLSDIPLLGLLFRNTRVIHKETELVIFVTPSLVGTIPEED